VQRPRHPLTAARRAAVSFDGDGKLKRIAIAKVGGNHGCNGGIATIVAIVFAAGGGG